MKIVKSESEIETMRISGKICAKAMKKVLESVKPGITTLSLDKIAREEIESNGAGSSFTTVEDYKWTTCITINEQIVHGIPTQRIIKDGDILSIDVGALYKGYHSDMAITVPVGKFSQEIKKFIDTGKKTLKKAIEMAKPDNYLGDISATIQENIESAGFSIVKNLTGHGVGRELHEEPMIPGFGKPKTGLKIRKGMTLAIEVIYAQKSSKAVLERDGWTISTEDGSLGGLFEQTVAIADNGPIVLTPYL